MRSSRLGNARGWYLIGASWCCNDQTLPAPPGTAYELRVLAAPEPAGAALGVAALTARRRIARAAVLAAALLGAALPARAVERYVRPYPQGSDSGNLCTSPTTPCATIQHALDVAGSGDVIRTVAWAYAEGLRIERALSGVLVEGGWAEDFSSRPATGYGQLHPPAGTARPLRVLASGVAVDVTFDRFHIYGGNVVGSGLGGGAIQVVALSNGSARLALRDGSSAGSRAEAFGGSIALSSDGGAGSQVLLELEDMSVSQNEVAGTDALVNGGGAVHGSCHEGRVELRARSSHFIDNRSAGGTLRFDTDAGCTSALLLEESEIRDNADGGVVVTAKTGGAATLDTVNTRVMDNGAGATGISHALYLLADGGAIEATSLNDTITGNGHGVVLDVWNANGSIGFDATNDILWGNGDPALSVDPGAHAAVEYSDLGAVEVVGAGVFEEGDGNFDADPLIGPDRRLTASSPAVDTGLCSRRVCTPQPFPEPPICIRVRVAPYADFDGDPRPTGAGCDVGADEYVPEPAGAVLAVASWVALGALRRRR